MSGLQLGSHAKANPRTRPASAPCVPTHIPATSGAPKGQLCLLTHAPCPTAVLPVGAATANPPRLHRRALKGASMEPPHTHRGSPTTQTAPARTTIRGSASDPWRFCLIGLVSPLSTHVKATAAPCPASLGCPTAPLCGTYGQLQPKGQGAHFFAS